MHAGPAGGLALVMVYGFPDDSRIYDRVARCSPAAVVVAVDWLSNGYSDSPRKGTGYVAS